MICSYMPFSSRHAETGTRGSYADGSKRALAFSEQPTITSTTKSPESASAQIWVRQHVPKSP